MATIGFAALAAATFRGNVATNVAATTEERDGILRPEVGDDDVTFFDPGTTTPQFNAPSLSGPTRASGPGHATTGGS